jgi:hypothetical protein
MLSMPITMPLMIVERSAGDGGCYTVRLVVEGPDAARKSMPHVN